MADSTLDSELFVLIDRWPGVPTIFKEPPGGFTGEMHHNVSIQQYRCGTKAQIYNDGGIAGDYGYSTFIYLQVGTQSAIALKSFVVPDSATDPYVITDDIESCIDAVGSLFAAVALSAITDAYYGWFWCGGVCPEAMLPAMAGNYVTINDVDIGGIAVVDLAAANTGGLGNVAADTSAIIGAALSADAI